MALPDSGNPADYTPEQIEELLRTDKTQLTKLQKAAVARYNFQKAKAEQAAQGATTAEGVPVPAAPQSPAPAGVPAAAGKPPATTPAKPKEDPAAAAAAKREEELRRSREEAAKYAYAARLRDAFPGKVEDLVLQKDKPCLVVRAGAVAEVLGAAKAAGFDHLAVLTATDYPPDRMEMVYELFSYSTKQFLAAKARMPRDAPTAASLSGLWAGAVWLEREVYDMFGVRFDGLHDHRRLLLPESWVGYPMRKDYDPTREQYVGLDETGEDVVSFQEEAGW